MAAATVVVVVEEDTVVAEGEDMAVLEATRCPILVQASKNRLGVSYTLRLVRYMC